MFATLRGNSVLSWVINISRQVLKRMLNTLHRLKIWIRKPKKSNTHTYNTWYYLYCIMGAMIYGHVCVCLRKRKNAINRLPLSYSERWRRVGRGLTDIVIITIWRNETIIFFFFFYNSRPKSEDGINHAIVGMKRSHRRVYSIH